MQLHMKFEKSLVQDFTTFKTKIFYISGGQISYDDTGEVITTKGSDSKLKPVIICIPGAGDTRAQYRYLLPPLKQHGFRIISCDVRGMGNSSTQWKTCRPVDITRDIELLIKHLKIPIRRGCIVIGHGESAVVPILLASKRPDIVRSIVLLSPITKCTVWEGLPLKLKTSALWFKHYKSHYGKKNEDNRPQDYYAYMSIVKYMLKDDARCALLLKYLTSPTGLNEGVLSRVRAPVFIATSKHSTTNGTEWIRSLLSFTVPMIETKNYNTGHFIHLNKFDELSRDLSKWFDKNSGPIWTNTSIEYDIMTKSKGIEKVSKLKSNLKSQKETVLVMD